MQGEARAHLYVRGDAKERQVTADDIQWPSEVDLINPEQVIATLDGPDAVLDMDIWIARDRGYRGAEAQETYSLGEIPIDAIFTPIQKVNFVVEHTRYGQSNDYDRLILEVLTDGTIEADDALAQSAQILMDHARVFADFNRKDGEAGAAASPFISDEVQNKPLADLGLSPRVLNALRSRQILTVGQVLTMDPDQLLSIRNFGPRSLNELRDKLNEFGYLPEGEASPFGRNATSYYDELASAMAGDGDEDADQEVAEAIASLRGDVTEGEDGEE
jgi:DNA-directed RNA polymerase subunit alpha